MPHRIERFLGPVQFPGSYWGADPAAVENLPHQRLAFRPRFIRALALIKKPALRSTSRGPSRLRRSQGHHQADESPRQATPRSSPWTISRPGSATSTNRNYRSSRTARLKILARARQQNPVTPTITSTKAIIERHHSRSLQWPRLEFCRHGLIPSLCRPFTRACGANSRELRRHRQIGRTHLMDAVPMRLGAGIRRLRLAAEHAIGRAESCAESRRTRPGGTASALDLTPTALPPLVIAKLAE